MSRGRLIGRVVAAVIAVAAVILLLRPSSSAQGPNGGPPVVGHPAPDFALRDTSGKEVRLSDERGHVVLLNFWATWCVPCRTEMPAIERVYRSHRSQFTAFGIDKQEPLGDVHSYAERYGLTFPLLLDPSLSAWNAYQVRIQPVSFWIDRNGVIRSIHYGPMSAATIERQIAKLSA